MNTVHPIAPKRVLRRRRQQGVTLILALISMVGMFLAAVSLIRSIDTGILVAGNLASKKVTLQATDQGTEVALGYIYNTATNTLNADNPAMGYYSSMGVTPTSWTADSAWTQARTLPADPNTGIQVSYLINRMCTLPSTAYNGKVGNVLNQCAAYVGTAANGSGDSESAGADKFGDIPEVLYRVTVRAVGPKGTSSIAQSMVAAIVGWR